MVRLLPEVALVLLCSMLLVSFSLALVTPTTNTWTDLKVSVYLPSDYIYNSKHDCDRFGRREIELRLKRQKSQW